MKIQIHRLHPGAVIPVPHHPGDAGGDLVAIESCVLAPGERAMVSTGLSIAIPEGFAGFVLPRSGLASRHGVTCANAPGLIDAGYRGEVKVALVNLDPLQSYSVQPGDRIAQLVILPTPDVEFDEVENLRESTRGEGGFGSTGR
jgi:dUTP pyrophosphatase